MLGGFARAEEKNGNVPSVALLQDRVLINIHFPKAWAEFPKQGFDKGFGFFAEMAAGARVERNVQWFARGKAQVLGMSDHGLG